MGCCATKPQVSRGDEAEEPVPIPSSRWPQQDQNADEEETQEAKKEVEASPDLNHEDNVKPKDVHLNNHHNKQQYLGDLFEKEEKIMLPKTENTQSKPTTSKSKDTMSQEQLEPETLQASTHTEKPKNKMMQRQSSKAERGTEDHAKPIEHDDRPKLVCIAPEDDESEQSIEAVSIPVDTVIKYQENEESAKPVKDNDSPAIVYVASGNDESVRSIKALPTPEDDEFIVVTDLESEELVSPIELIDDEPEDVIVGPGKIELIQSDEAELAPKVIVVEEIPESAKPIEPIEETVTGRIEKIESSQAFDPETAPKAGTEKLKEANATTNQKTDGLKTLVDYNGDPIINGFPGDIKAESVPEAASSDTVKPAKE